jgi:preprotein translocase subunit YajC
MKKFFILSLTSLTSVFAESATSAQPSPTAGLLQPLILIGLAVVFFYFILYRPEQKRRKKMEAQRNAMKKGDRVTAMGIVGTIDQIKENTVVVKMVEGAKIEFLKAAISDIQPVTSEEK